jgi:hypothetical protein
MNAPVLGIFFVFPEINARVANHAYYWSLAIPLKPLAQWLALPGGVLPLLALAASGFAGFLVWSRLRSKTLEHAPSLWAWLTICGLTAILCLHSQHYNHLFLVFTWLWVLREPSSRILRWFVVPASIYVLILHRVVVFWVPFISSLTLDSVAFMHNAVLYLLLAGAFARFIFELDLLSLSKRKA